MIPMHSVSRPRATVRASVLAGLILLGAALSVCAEADGSTVDLRSELISHVYEVERGWIRAQAVYRPGGALHIDSNLGRFDGEWMVSGDELCIAFDYGPATGLNCSAVDTDEEGALRLAEGVTLRPVARIRHFQD